MNQHTGEAVAMEENLSISNLTSASGEASASSGNGGGGGIYPPPPPHAPSQSQPLKKKRNQPGNPDPEAEVIALSPRTLMATNRFVCEICKKGFQRDQNLQLHRRGHNLPWKLKQRASKELIRKKVYVCPEAGCVHHHPSRALGDLTGIKKHFCRKHGEKKWKCDKCSKKYAVQSDWKAHSKTCGTKEYRCDCGTLFSRRDSFITHRAFCDALAEESARSINGNILLSSSQAVASSTSQMINGHEFPMKKEQQSFSLGPEIPPWLACPPPHPITPISHSHNREADMNLQDPNPNTGLGPVMPPSPHISATALLQKAAQMGATMSGKSSSSSAVLMHHHQSQRPHHQTPPRVTADSNFTAQHFGLDFSSSRDAAIGGSAYAYVGGGGGGGTCAGPPPPPPGFLQEMMNHFASSGEAGNHHGFEGSTFEDANYVMNPTRDNNDDEEEEDHFSDSLMRSKTATAHEFGSGGTEGGNEGMTRDFLGLRPLSNNDIFRSIAGLGNYSIINPPASAEQHHSPNHQKSWQG